LGALLCAVKGWRGRTRLYLPLSLGLYMIALGCKELAVVMPVLVLSITFLWKKTSPEQLNTASLAPGILASNLKLELPTETEIEREEKSEPEGTRDEAIEEGDPIEPSPPVPEMAVRAIRALEYTSPFILLALTYLLLRFFIFGQSLGGYAGSFGIAMTHKFYWRWIEHDMLARLILPMPDYVQEISSQPRLAATIVVALCVLVGLLKFRFMEVRKRLFLIIFVWVLITLLPIANLLILDADLRNSRLLMFFTIPMSMLWPALLFHPTELAIDFGFAHYLRRFALTIGTALMTILIGSFAWCTFHVNKDWERAGYMVQQVWKGTVSLAGTLKKNERVILLGLPTSFRATHVIYNGSTFYDLLKPPFITPSITDKVVTFLPYIVGPSEIIDATRLKILLEDREHHHSIWLWNDFEEVFYPVKVNQSPESPSLIKMKVGKEFAPGIWRPLGNAKYQVEDGNTMILTDVQEEDGLIVTGLNINPLDADFLEFDIAITADPTDLTELMPLSVSWGATGGNSSIHALKKNEKDRQTNAHLRIRLSNNWRWYTKEHVDRFIIQVGAAKNIVIKNIMLTKADHLVP
ncbi:MAG: hypothetical protein K8F91_00865, partial [Candidatus Obscuribacterales bacterium]|nr:hypothetical protein [Candidatus Obscuribacterales bacterium]